METLNATGRCPKFSQEERSARELANRIRKLRWMGLEKESRRQLAPLRRSDSLSRPSIPARWRLTVRTGMIVAAKLVAGSDIWLNTPLPPFEASGTSGMIGVGVTGLFSNLAVALVGALAIWWAAEVVIARRNSSGTS